MWCRELYVNWWIKCLCGILANNDNVANWLRDGVKTAVREKPINHANRQSRKTSTPPPDPCRTHDPRQKIPPLWERYVRERLGILRERRDTKIDEKRLGIKYIKLVCICATVPLQICNDTVVVLQIFLGYQTNTRPNARAF